MREHLNFFFGFSIEHTPRKHSLQAVLRSGGSMRKSRFMETHPVSILKQSDRDAGGRYRSAGRYLRAGVRPVKIGVRRHGGFGSESAQGTGIGDHWTSKS
jgi:hypothetical protein